MYFLPFILCVLFVQKLYADNTVCPIITPNPQLWISDIASGKSTCISSPNCCYVKYSENGLNYKCEPINYDIETNSYSKTHSQIMAQKADYCAKQTPYLECVCGQEHIEVLRSDLYVQIIVPIGAVILIAFYFWIKELIIQKQKRNETIQLFKQGQIPKFYTNKNYITKVMKANERKSQQKLNNDNERGHK